MRHQMTADRRPDQGFTLLEMVIAILVLSVGTIAVLGVVNQSRRAIGEEHLRFLAQSVAVNRAQEIRLYGAEYPLPAEVEQGAYIWQVETGTTRTEAGLIRLNITVSGADRPGAQLTAYVAPGAAP